MPPRRVLVGTYVAFGVAVAAGLYLAAVAGWELLVVGRRVDPRAACSTPAARGPYGYEGLGELFVFLFFGLVAVAGSYFVQTEELRWEAFALGVPVGLLAAAILVVNNVRDIDTDRRAGKRTLAVKLGPRPGARPVRGDGRRWPSLVPVALVAGALGLGAAAARRAAAGAAAACGRCATRTDGPALNGALAATGRLLAVFSLLLAGGVLLS